nr:glutathione S-transferase N-terminal domain-containing protein [Neptunicella marina]
MGAIILFVDWLFTPKGPKRNVEQQAKVDERISGLALYQFKACPFCVKVRRECKRLGINLPLQDAKRDLRVRNELLEQGGKIKVPCLRIEQDNQVRWLYESSDIVSFLQQRVNSTTV